MNKKQKADELELLSPPGATILETLDAKGMTITDLAEAIGWSRRDVNNLISGRDVITEPLAQRLQEILGIDAQFWLYRERNYRDKLAILNNQ